MPDELPPDRTLRLMSDYGCGCPLWGFGGATRSESYGLSEKLDGDLRAWQEHFEKHFHWETEWSSPEAARWYEHRGRELLQRLDAELPDHYIELDLWPVRGGLVRIESS